MWVYTYLVRKLSVCQWGNCQPSKTDCVCELTLANFSSQSYRRLVDKQLSLYYTLLTVFSRHVSRRRVRRVVQLDCWANS